MISSAVFLCLMGEVNFENALVNSHALQVVSFVLKKLIERKMKTNADTCGLAGHALSGCSGIYLDYSFAF